MINKAYNFLRIYKQGRLYASYQATLIFPSKLLIKCHFRGTLINLLMFKIIQIADNQIIRFSLVKSDLYTLALFRRQK